MGFLGGVMNAHGSQTYCTMHPPSPQVWIQCQDNINSYGYFSYVMSSDSPYMDVFHRFIFFMYRFEIYNPHVEGHHLCPKKQSDLQPLKDVGSSLYNIYTQIMQASHNPNSIVFKFMGFKLAWIILLQPCTKPILTTI